MSNVRRIYVEKKSQYAVAAGQLLDDLRDYLGAGDVTGCRILVRYDIENISEETYEKAKHTVFSEPPVDYLYEEDFPKEDSDISFSVEYLPGQFDQRADSAVQCVKLLNEDEEPVIRTATTYVISGRLSEEEHKAVVEHCVNPVDSRIASDEKPETLAQKFDVPADVAVLEGFKDLPEDRLKELYDSLGLAMTFRDFLHIQKYFRGEENRDPSMTEIRVLDTYWSDHCRHTTFATELKNVTFDSGDYEKPIKDTYREYQDTFREIYKDRDDKFPCLMDIALLAMKKIRAQGGLEDMEVSDEINACSIVVPVDIDGKTEEWLVTFKNETHNHPTEIEPFGGAATCLGGAIRDPLSGRTYVYQAMRVTGAADPRKPLKDTLPGKLPQRKIVNEAADGYSSYGNQIGLATGLVDEVYHPNYVAKRMEIGAVMGAAPRRCVKRLNSDPGDIIVLLGGRTGRDGCGGATGSSKAHNTQSLDTCGAEVQKGNPPTERKLQRLFRREEAAKLIKKCNDFGAGGVSVAIGELADGLDVNLDLVPKKYAGLDGTELAISESQERMAVVLDPKDLDQFMAYAAEENLEATAVAKVTSEPRLVLRWRGKKIVDISRAFLNTNGAHQETDVEVEIPKRSDCDLDTSVKHGDFSRAFTDTLSDLNVCSKRGLSERFDGSIGAGSVTMPFGGKYQQTPVQTMIAKLPVLEGHTDTVTMMSYGYDPYLSSWSPYHGAVYAVVHSVAKIVASGGDYKKIRFTFQEFFKRMSEDPKRWSAPFTALLGAFHAQLGFGLPSIGGKDSMSGSFNDIDVPPTLVSFAVDVAHEQDVLTDELKDAGDDLVLFPVKRDQYDLPDYDNLKQVYDAVSKNIKSGLADASYAVGFGGILEAAAKMAFGNELGVHFDESVSVEDLSRKQYGAVILAVPSDRVESLEGDFRVVAHVTDDGNFTYGDQKVSMADALKAWSGTLEKVFPTHSAVKPEKIETKLYDAKDIYVCSHKVARPRVFIPVFPGTNCEYDSAKAFRAAGADVSVKVYRNITAEGIRESVESFTKEIDQAQIIMFPGGFSAGDEPDGSGKFIATAFRNEKLREAVNDLLNKRDGLVLGICNGFQAVIKLGLVPYGEIREQKEDSPTLTTNSIGRHQSKMVYTKVVSNKSPWLQKAELGGVYCIPASHGEGRFVADSRWIDSLFANGQVATQYVDLDGNPTMDEDYNINGSYAAIEGITSADGRVLGKMAHSERIGESVAVNTFGQHDQQIFRSGVEYFM